MFIFVDESGTFTSASAQDSWCVIAAYVCPESSRSQIEQLVKRLRLECNGGKEAKLKHMSEGQYIAFLERMTKLDGVVFAVAVDIGLHSTENIISHRENQAEGVTRYIDKLRYDSAKEGLQKLADEIRKLPPQLYTQLMCQVTLFQKILTRAPLYFVQRFPVALGHFRWRIDSKDTVPTRYESAFRLILPGLLQSISMREPMLMLEGADYRHFERFYFPKGQEPMFLKTDYGIDHGEVNDLGKMIREDFKFVDSASTAGVQIADLFSSGIRRLLMGGFSEQERVAKLLGMNVVQGEKGEPCVRLISLDKTGLASDQVTRLVGLINQHARPMMAG